MDDIDNFVPVQGSCDECHLHNAIYSETFATCAFCSEKCRKQFIANQW